MIILYLWLRHYHYFFSKYPINFISICISNVYKNVKMLIIEDWCKHPL